jgi:hypothetical protein
VADQITIGRRDHVITILFIVGSILGVIGSFLMFRSGRRMEEEGKKVGFDFYSRDATLMWFLPDRLPVPMRPFARQARLAAIVFLWPACAIMIVALLLK